MNIIHLSSITASSYSGPWERLQHIPTVIRCETGTPWRRHLSITWTQTKQNKHPCTFWSRYGENMQTLHSKTSARSWQVSERKPEITSKISKLWSNTCLDWALNCFHKTNSAAEPYQRSKYLHGRAANTKHVSTLKPCSSREVKLAYNEIDIHTSPLLTSEDESWPYMFSISLHITYSLKSTQKGF